MLNERGRQETDTLCLGLTHGRIMQAAIGPIQPGFMFHCMLFAVRHFVATMTCIVSTLVDSVRITACDALRSAVGSRVWEDRACRCVACYLGAATSASSMLHILIAVTGVTDVLAHCKRCSMAVVLAA